eukprot:gene2960-3245_t
MLDMESAAGLAAAKVSAELVAAKCDVLAEVHAQTLQLKTAAGEIDVLKHSVTVAQAALVENKMAAAQATAAVSEALHKELAGMKIELASVKDDLAASVTEAKLADELEFLALHDKFDSFAALTQRQAAAAADASAAAIRKVASEANAGMQALHRRLDEAQQVDTAVVGFEKVTQDLTAETVTAQTAWDTKLARTMSVAASQLQEAVLALESKIVASASDVTGALMDQLSKSGGAGELQISALRQELLTHAAVARPDLIISLDLLRKELEERLGTGRTEVAQGTQQQIEQMQQALAVTRSELQDHVKAQQQELQNALHQRFSELQAALTSSKEDVSEAQLADLRLTEFTEQQALRKLRRGASCVSGTGMELPAQHRQAAAAAAGNLAARLDALSVQLMSDIEKNLLGSWGDKLKSAFAAESALQVDQALKGCQQDLRQLQQSLPATIAEELAAQLQTLRPQLLEQLMKEQAAGSNVAAEGLKAAKAEVKADVTGNIEKKMHAALDAALVTLKSEGSSGGGVGQLKKEFEELRAAIKRNAMWLLQGPA